MNLKKVLFMMVVFLATTLQMIAAPAFPWPMTVRQADGTMLTVQQYGDEYHHWMTTTDGTLVVHTAQGYFVAQIDDQGIMTASRVLAHEASQRNSVEQQAVLAQQAKRDLFFQRGQQHAKAQQRAISINTNDKYTLHTGSPRILVILAAFQDIDFIINEPVHAIDQLLNGETQEDLGNNNSKVNASVRKYYEACSYGQFSPQFDVVGPIKLPKNMADYGGTDPFGYDDAMSTLCLDTYNAVQAENLVSDWSIYDNDHDNYIEQVCIIFAGYGQNQGGEVNTIWAKNSTQNMSIVNGLTISRFCCNSELFYPEEGYMTDINGTGTFTHEFSHGMGLPDIYATSSSGYVNNQSMESWDIMDYGIYNNNGYAPALFLAWEQETMGWMEIVPLTESNWIPNLLPLEEGGTAYKIQNAADEKDFIVLENIQKRGFNKYAKSHGLLVYHIGYPYSKVNMGDSPNNTPGHPAVALVPADGLLISGYLKGDGKPYTKKEYNESLKGDPFPGTSNVTELYDDTERFPNYCFYSALPDDAGNDGVKASSLRAGQSNALFAVNFSLKGIEETETGQMKCFYGKPDEEPTAIQNVTVAATSQADNTIYNLQGQRVTNPKKGQLVIRQSRLTIYQ